MFTIEFDEDETLITILDKTDELEDTAENWVLGVKHLTGKM